MLGNSPNGAWISSSDQTFPCVPMLDGCDNRCCMLISSSFRVWVSLYVYALFGVGLALQTRLLQCEYNGCHDESPEDAQSARHNRSRHSLLCRRGHDGTSVRSITGRSTSCTELDGAALDMGPQVHEHVEDLEGYDNDPLDYVFPMFSLQLCLMQTFMTLQMSKTHGGTLWTTCCTTVEAHRDFSHAGGSTCLTC